LSIGVPIPRRPLRCRRWSPFAGGQFGRVVVGTYEPDLTELFSERVVPGSVVFDIGAHSGYYTLLAATLLRGSGRVLAMEPNPRNLRHLRKHISMNRLGNVEVIPSAICDREGTAASRLARDYRCTRINSDPAESELPCTPAEVDEAPI
jgi:hypothetical protein